MLLTWRITPHSKPNSSPSFGLRTKNSQNRKTENPNAPLYKPDTSLRRTAEAGPDGVRLRESWLYTKTIFYLGVGESGGHSVFTSPLVKNVC